MLTPAFETLSTYSLQVLNIQRTMKTRITNSNLILVSAACAIIFIAGCASTETAKTTSLFSAAGFYTRTPQTAKQKELYATLPSNKIECAKAKGKVLYVFKDEKAGVAYIGGESQHQKYLQLCKQQHLAEPPEEEMNQPLANAWANQWGGGRDVTNR
jgi:hypothetical protein